MKDPVMLSSHERVETLKLRKRTRLSPIPEDFLVFPVKRCPSPKLQAHRHYVFMCFCAWFPADHDVHAVRRVCMREMDGGCRLGFFRDLALAPSHTHIAASPSLSAASRRRLLCGPEEKRWVCDGEGTRAWSPLRGSREQTGIHQSANGGGRRVILQSYLSSPPIADNDGDGWGAVVVAYFLHPNMQCSICLPWWFTPASLIRSAVWFMVAGFISR